MFFAERCSSIVEGYKKPLRRIRKVKVHGLLVNIARLIRSCGDAGYFAATWV